MLVKERMTVNPITVAGVDSEKLVEALKGLSVEVLDLREV
jgi:hypothetical protein